MSTNVDSFDRYLIKDDLSLFSNQLNVKWNTFRSKVRYAKVFVEEKTQLPDFIIKVLQIGIIILSNTSKQFTNQIKVFSQFLKDSKNFIYFSKGIQSIDCLIYFQSSFKNVLFIVAGLSLSFFSALSILERISLLDSTAIKISLSTIPIIGPLPYGGLVALSVIGISIASTISSIEKRKSLSKNISDIRLTKLNEWSYFDVRCVNRKINKYQQKVLVLSNQIKTKQVLIDEGRAKLNAYPKKNRIKRIACQKAINEISQSQKKSNDLLNFYQNKKKDWTLIQKNWNSLKSIEIENFRSAKYRKWEKKVELKQIEKKANSYAIMKCVFTAAKPVFSILALGMVLPVGLQPGVEIIGTYVAGKSFFMKRSIKKLKGPSPVKISNYIRVKV